MKYNTKWLLKRTEEVERVKYLLFWGHRPSNDGSVTSSCFSQWFAGHSFSEKGVVYKTAEHFMMAGKAKLFNDEENFAKIIKSNSAAEAKKIGRMVRNFDQVIWEESRCEIVIRGNYLKFIQNEGLKKYLLSTDSRVLVEASPRDRIWGIGMGKHNENAKKPENWRGKNLLGFCLMEVRDQLQ